MAGSAALFILIGSLRYLETFMPAWQAWLIMGATSAVVAAALFVALFLIIRKQLATPKTTAKQEKYVDYLTIRKNSRIYRVSD